MRDLILDKIGENASKEILNAFYKLKGYSFLSRAEYQKIEGRIKAIVIESIKEELV